MARPVKWSRDLHPIRERAQRSRTETWSRKDIEILFGVGRATAQTLMKAIGEVQNVAGAHFVERTSLLAFLDSMVAATSVDEELRLRLTEAQAPPINRQLRITLPADLRSITTHDLPSHISLSPGRLLIEADTPTGIVEALALLAQALQNDLAGFEQLVRVDLPKVKDVDDELQKLISNLRRTK